MVPLLAERMTDVDVLDGENETALNLACDQNHIACVRALLAQGARPEVEDAEFALHIACSNDHDECTRLLLENGANVDATDGLSDTALHWACSVGGESCVRLLLDAQANPNFPGVLNRTPLWWACRNGHSSCVQLLLDRNVDLNRVSGDGTSPLHEACAADRPACIGLLLGAGADANVRGHAGRTPLHSVVAPEAVHALVEAGAEVDAVDEHGMSALCEAALSQSAAVVEAFLKRGANSSTALFYATSGRNTSGMHLLLQYRDIPREAKSTALVEASAASYYYLVRLLVEAGADVNAARGTNNRTSLEAACGHADEAVVRFLLEAGADPRGKACLPLAAARGEVGSVRALLDHGAHPNETDADGDNALDKARSYELIQLLLVHGGRPPTTLDVYVRRRIGIEFAVAVSANQFVERIRFHCASLAPVLWWRSQVPGSALTQIMWRSPSLREVEGYDTIETRPEGLRPVRVREGDRVRIKDVEGVWRVETSMGSHADLQPLLHTPDLQPRMAVPVEHLTLAGPLSLVDRELNATASDVASGVASIISGGSTLAATLRSRIEEFL